MAIVVFEDLECSECARAYPVIWEAANAHKVPVVLHDFPLPRHNWSFQAAVWARYFDQSSVTLGNAFREFLYTNQSQINRENLQQWVQKFGAEKSASLPSTIDPDGKLAEKVRADYALGQRIGIERTPTLWVVNNNAVSQPLVEEVKNREQLGQIIDEMLKKAPPATQAENASPAKAAPAKTKNKSAKTRMTK